MSVGRTFINESINNLGLIKRIFFIIFLGIFRMAQAQQGQGQAQPQAQHVDPAAQAFQNIHIELANNTWEQLKEQLAVRFSDVTDRQMALSLLRAVRQKPGENIQLFAERILSLAEDACHNQGETL